MTPPPLEGLGREADQGWAEGECSSPRPAWPDAHAGEPVVRGTLVPAEIMLRKAAAGVTTQATRQHSGTSFALHPTHRASQQHPVMSEANDFDHAIPAQAVDDDVPRASNPLLLRNQTTPQTERVNTDTGDL